MEPKLVRELDKISEHFLMQGTFEIARLPDELLEQVFSKLSEIDLLMRVSRVCKYWKSIVDRQSVWRLKCNYENLHVDSGNSYRDAYFSESIFRRNLIKNPYAIEDFDHWEIMDGSHGFKTENAFYGKGVGVKQPNSLKLPEKILPVVCNWVTTYYNCSKYQLIDLLAVGFSEKWLDEMEAAIHISEWYAARFDCGCVYHLEVHLLDGNEKSLDHFEQVKQEQQWSTAEWKKVSYVFPCKVREGLRYIKFIHSGKDTQFWAGHYGSKFTGASVKFDFKALHV
ncbi:F-box only protein 6-like isoform X2 [Tubulanus polymorphus]